MMTRHPDLIDLDEAKRAVRAVIEANPGASYADIWNRVWKMTHQPDHEPTKPVCENWLQQYNEEGDPQPRIPLCIVGQVLNYWGVLDDIDESHEGEAFEEEWWEPELSLTEDAALYMRAVQERQDHNNDEPWAQCIEYVESHWEQYKMRRREGQL